jgi:D-xylose transport system permease protein
MAQPDGLRVRSGPTTSLSLLDEVMSNTSHSPATKSTPDSAFGRFLRATEIDPRLLGMVGALLLIWVIFHLYGAILLDGGTFLTPRNLWNLSVQTASIGIMATGMVLVIITRNIDLSVGSIVGVVGMYAGLLQVEWLPPFLGLGHPALWIIAVVFGIVLGALIGRFWPRMAGRFRRWTRPSR